jgi:hypothetical protein
VIHALARGGRNGMLSSSPRRGAFRPEVDGEEVKEREGEGLISFVLSRFLEFGGFLTILSVDFI